MNQSIAFSFRLLVMLAITFGGHLFIRNYFSYNLFADKIMLSYSVNFIMAASIFVFMDRFKYKFKNTLGFLFMGGSSLKFIIFFIVFQPGYKLDGVTSKSEFAAFFIPYALCLSLEVYSLVKMLNKVEHPKSNENQ